VLIITKAIAQRLMPPRAAMTPSPQQHSSDAALGFVLWDMQTRRDPQHRRLESA